MRMSLLTIFSSVALLCGATIYQTEALSQDRPDTTGQIPKMLVRPQQKQVTPPSVKPGATVIAYEMAWQVHEPKAVAQRFTGALDVLLGKDAAKLVDYDSLKSIVEGDRVGSWVRIRNTPVLAKYQPEYDEIRFIHEERDVSYDAAGDIGEDGIREKAETYLKQLGENGVIDPRLYAQAVMQLGYTMVGEGSVKNKKLEPGRIVEYRITFRPRLNGFEMANTGLRLGILPSGQLASVRLGGVTPAGNWEDGVLKPNIKGSAQQVRVSTKELMDRFYKKVAKEAEPQIAWSRIMYVMPDGTSKAVVEPMLLISYTELRKIDGQQVASRRKTLAYSLTNPGAAPIDFDAPPSKHEETEITRKR
jgi:hypothetical protein